jgi:lysozyme family protein
MIEFEHAVAFVLARETVFKKGHHGNYDYVISTNIKEDRGGLTKYGIDQRSHPGVDIEALTLLEAKDIYKREYWLKGQCDKLEWPLSLVHFDGCVNCGIGQATKFLQRAVGADDDGVFGKKTLAAVVSACSARSAETIAEEVVKLRTVFYKQLAAKNETDKRFLKGWLNRIEKLQEYLA